MSFAPPVHLPETCSHLAAASSSSSRSTRSSPRRRRGNRGKRLLPGTVPARSPDRLLTPGPGAGRRCGGRSGLSSRRGKSSAGCDHDRHAVVVRMQCHHWWCGQPVEPETEAFLERNLSSRPIRKAWFTCSNCEGDHPAPARPPSPIMRKILKIWPAGERTTKQGQCRSRPPNPGEHLPGRGSWARTASRSSAVATSRPMWS